MNKVLLEEKYVLEYIRDIINDVKTKSDEISNARYHHNASYRDAASICKHGILSMSDIVKLGLKNYSEEILNKMSDTDSHINGIDMVSLSVVGLDDLYADEFEYDPFDPFWVDFIVSSDIKARRSASNYGNEFISNSISIDKLKAVDFRILKLIDKFSSNNGQEQNSNGLIEKFNYLKDVALTIKECKTQMFLREMSSDSPYILDLDKLSNTPSLVLKK